MSVARYYHTATLLPGGKVLIAAGGVPGDGDPLPAALYDPAAGTFSATGSMTAERHYCTATLLPSGKTSCCGIWRMPYGNLSIPPI